MRKIISLVLVMLSFTTFAVADCRVIEYPDHSEAVCVGDAAQTPSSDQKTGQEQIPAQEQTLAAAQIPESEQTDVPPENIVRNDLARLHMASWLKTRPGQ
jgi:hypothetical protein